MASLRLTTQLKQQMILTPQLRQRIEMLQMTSLELAELIEQEMVSNPVLEEVYTNEEIQEIAEKILDQNAGGNEESYENGKPEDFSSENFSDNENSYEDFTAEMPSLNGNKEEVSAE